MGSYTSEFPNNVGVDPAIQSYFEQFYKISDNPEGHEQYADQFTKDATYIMPSGQVKGRADIVAIRHKMWEKVASRAHNPIKIFPYGSNANEFMIYGTLTFGMKVGGEVFKEWAARGNLMREDGKIKMSFYQVYFDTAS